MAKDKNGKELSKGGMVLVACTVTETPGDGTHVRLTPARGFSFDPTRGDFIANAELVEAVPDKEAEKMAQRMEQATPAADPNGIEAAKAAKPNDVDASQRAGAATAAYYGPDVAQSEGAPTGGEDAADDSQDAGKEKSSRTAHKATKAHETRASHGAKKGK